MKIDVDYHVYSKQGSYATPHAINISYSLINVYQREKQKRMLSIFFVFTSDEYPERVAILVVTENLDE